MNAPRLTEALGDPPHELWVTPEGQACRRVSVAALTTTTRYGDLRNPAVLQSARVTPDARGVTFPGGVILPARAFTLAPDGTPPLDLIAVVPPEQRYRPLFSFLYRSSSPPVGAYPKYVAHADVLRKHFHWPPRELDVITARYPAPPDVTLARLADVALFLTAFLGAPLTPGLRRAPWPYAQRTCPTDIRLHSIRGCLEYARPDLIERPCLTLAHGHLKEEA